MASERRGKRLKHERRVLWLALLTGVPGLILALALLWLGDFAPPTQWTLTLPFVIAWPPIAPTLPEQGIRPLPTIPNMLGALRVRRGTFRQEGLPHELLVLADVSRTLSREERQAWQRLIRVLGHELNNSLAPIRSLAQSLAELVRRDPPPPDWRKDLDNGLGVIGSRAESLSRLMAAYATLARLPVPRLEPLSVSEWVRRVAALETRRAVVVCPGPEVTIQADGAQLDQLLINLVRHAVDATCGSGAEGEVRWGTLNGQLEVWVRDGGPGLADTGNLFVPFFTTKPTGSGIGLVLSRQIAEAHGGTLTLANRVERRGCEAGPSLPIAG